MTQAGQHLRAVETLTRDLPLNAGLEDTLTHLAERMAKLLDAEGVYLLRERECEQVGLRGSAADVLVAAPSLLRAALRGPMGRLRGRGGVRLEPLPADLVRGEAGVVALLGRIDAPGDEPTVLVLLRRRTRGGFDASARVTLEAMIAHCTHVLRNSAMVTQLQAASLETVAVLANVIETRDQYTRGHSERVGRLAAMLGRALHLAPRQIAELEWAGLLHDVGKIATPTAILNKRGGLSAGEFSQVQQHPVVGFEVLRSVSSLAPILPAVLHHHERYDGGGYPHGLRGNAIPQAARIVQIADIFDALTTDRPYRARLTISDALAELERGAGSVSDPLLTRVFVQEVRSRQRAEAARL